MWYNLYVVLICQERGTPLAKKFCMQWGSREGVGFRVFRSKRFSLSWWFQNLDALLLQRFVISVLCWENLLWNKWRNFLNFSLRILKLSLTKTCWSQWYGLEQCRFSTTRQARFQFSVAFLRSDSRNQGSGVFLCQCWRSSNQSCWFAFATLSTQLSADRFRSRRR